MKRRGFIGRLAALAIGAPIAARVLPQIELTNKAQVVRDVLAIQLSTEQFAALLVEPFTRDKVFAPFKRGLGAYMEVER